MTTKELIDFFEEENFIVNLINETADIETWTAGGVNMILCVCPFTIEEFISQADYFDVDEEIDLHRQNRKYKEDFSIRQSLEDFEKYHNRLKKVVEKLKKFLN